jgi:hypothetical protein
MESKPEEEQKATQKHEKLVEDENPHNITEVEAVKNKYTENIVSPFISQSKSWDQEQFGIPEDIQKNIVEKLGFVKPSGI